MSTTDATGEELTKEELAFYHSVRFHEADEVIPRLLNIIDRLRSALAQARTSADEKSKAAIEWCEAEIEYADTPLRFGDGNRIVKPVPSRVIAAELSYRAIVKRPKESP